MKKLLVLAVMVVLLAGVAITSAEATISAGTPCPFAGCPSPTFGTIINFDELTTDTLLAAGQYAGLGVTSITNVHANGVPLGVFGGSQSAPNYVGTGISVDWDAVILIEFASLQAKIGIGLADGIGADSFDLLAADLTVLESHVAPSGTNTYSVLERGSADIKFLQITCDFCAIDDLQFTASAVPAPLALTLLGVGLVAVAVIRRRR